MNLCTVLGMKLPFLNAYLDSIGKPNFHRGANFAAGGSTIRPATANSICPFSFVSKCLSSYASKLELSPPYLKVHIILSWSLRWVVTKFLVGKKFDKYVPEEDYFYNGLYMFDIGQNDLAIAFYSKSYEEVVASIPDYLAQFQAGVQRLYNEGGARNFWIHNTGPLGCLAQNIAKFGTSKSSLDEIGCVKTHNLAARIFTYVDVFAIKLDLIKNHSRYGINSDHHIVEEIV